MVLDGPSGTTLSGCLVNHERPRPHLRCSGQLDVSLIKFLILLRPYLSIRWSIGLGLLVNMVCPISPASRMTSPKIPSRISCSCILSFFSFWGFFYCGTLYCEWRHMSSFVSEVSCRFNAKCITLPETSPIQYFRRHIIWNQGNSRTSGFFTPRTRRGRLGYSRFFEAVNPVRPRHHC